MKRCWALLALAALACWAEEAPCEKTVGGLEQADEDLPVGARDCPLCIAFMEELSAAMEYKRPDKDLPAAKRRKILRDEARADEMLEGTSNALATEYKFVNNGGDHGMGKFFRHADLYRRLEGQEESLRIARAATGDSFYSASTFMGASLLLERFEDDLIDLIAKDASYDTLYDTVCKQHYCQARHTVQDEDAHTDL